MARVYNADPTAELELKNAVQEKNAKYTIRDNPSLHSLLRGY